MYVYIYIYIYIYFSLQEKEQSSNVLDGIVELRIKRNHIRLLIVMIMNYIGFFYSLRFVNVVLVTQQIVPAFEFSTAKGALVPGQLAAALPKVSRQ